MRICLQFEKGSSRVIVAFDKQRGVSVVIRRVGIEVLENEEVDICVDDWLLQERNSEDESRRYNEDDDFLWHSGSN